MHLMDNIEAVEKPPLYRMRGECVLVRLRRNTTHPVFLSLKTTL